jgi:hypothetical protein
MNRSAQQYQEALAQVEVRTLGQPVHTRDVETRVSGRLKEVIHRDEEAVRQSRFPAPLEALME